MWPDGGLSLSGDRGTYIGAHIKKFAAISEPSSIWLKVYLQVSLYLQTNMISY